MSQINGEKRRAACDECRVRKMKCTGEYPVCQRCQKENIVCLYSPQKKMGRPRKRRREGDDPENLGLDALEQFPASSGFDLAATDLLYDFGVNPSSHSPFLNPPDLPFGTQFDLGLSSLDPILVPLSNFTDDHGNGPCNSNCHEARDAVLLQNENQMHAEGLSISPNHNQTRGNVYNNQIPFQAAALPSFPTPSSSRNNSIPPNQCACLLEMSHAISTLRSLPTHTFPESLIPIRRALRTSQSLLQCPLCPKESTTAMQNIMFLATLLTSITDAYRSLLTSIDQEAARALQTGEKKQFRVGDSDPSRAHLHTGTTDCPMGFNIALAGPEWKMLARKVVEADILAPSSPFNPALGTHQSPRNEITVLGLVNQLEERQIRWHEGRVHEHFAGTNGERCVPKEGEEFHCLRMVKMVRSHVDMMNLGGGE